MPGLDEPSHWIIIAIVAALVFGGYKKLPEMARSAGRSLRIFKTEMKGLADDDEARSATGEQPTVVAAPAPSPASAVAPAVPLGSSGAVVTPAVTPTPVYTVAAVSDQQGTDPTAPPAV